MKIAIIGSGISGLTSAYRLHRDHQITLFEATDRIGGHTHTVDIRLRDRTYAIDTGFSLFNDRTYPNFIRLLKQLNVPLKACEMSFSVSDPLSQLEFSSKNWNSLFAQRSNLLSPSFWSLARDIRRFNKESLDDHANHRIAAQVTLGEYVRLGGYSRRFIDLYLAPMGAAIWSLSISEVLNLPLVYFVRFFDNYGLLSVSQPQSYVVEGGARAYIEPLIQGYSQCIRLSCPVFEVNRDHLGVTVVSAYGIERFDKIIFACHSDQALKMLSTPSLAEQQILGALRYDESEVVLHVDERLLPIRPLARAGWNCRLGDSANQQPTVTYNMNLLQGLEAPETFCISLNQTGIIDPALVLGRFRYSHLQYSLDGVAAQQRAHELLGANHSYFCGAYWGSGFHEDGVVSAMRVADALQRL